MTRRRATSRASSIRSPTGSSIGLDVMQVWRNDRFGRGGDHTEFLNAGFPAVRHLGRGRELQLAAPGSADRERHQIWRHDRQDGFPLSGQGDQAERRRPGRDRQRAAAARGEVEGAVSTDTTVSWAVGSGRDGYRRPLAADRCQPMGKGDSHRCRAGIEAMARVPGRRSAGLIARLACKRRSIAQGRARRRLGVRRLVGEQGWLRKPGCLGGAGRRVQALCAPPKT